MPDYRNTFKLEAAGTLTTGVKDRWVAPFAGEVINAVATVGTAPTGAAAIVDIEKNGVTVFSTSANKPTIAAATKTSPLSKAPDVAAFAAGDVLAINVTQIGSTVAGSDLDVVVQYVVR